MTVNILAAGALLAAPEAFKVIDARRKHEFEAGHVPDAISMEWEDWCDPAPVASDNVLNERGYWGVLKSAPDDWYAERLGACGLSSIDPIAVYAEGPASRGREGRIAWMLLYLGARQLSLVGGGLSGWLAAGGATEQTGTPPTPGRFKVSRQTSRRRTLPELSEALETGSFPRLVDTRSLEEFNGQSHPYLPRRGHLPGALNIPFDDLFDASDRYIDRTTHNQYLKDSLRDQQNIVAYCEVGVRASLFALIHEAHTGHPMPVYDGSLIEWSLHPDLPMEPK